MWAGAGMEAAQVHWQTGQGDKDGGGGDEGLGGRTGQEPNTSGAGAETEALGGSAEKGSRLKVEALGQTGCGCGESGVTEAGRGSEEETSSGELAAHVGAKGEVMRGMGEGGCGEKETAGRWGGSVGKPGCHNGAGGAKSFSKMEDS